MSHKYSKPLLLVSIAAFGFAFAAPAIVSAQDGLGPPPVKARKLPKMRVPVQDFNWGKVLSGEKVQHAFKVHNDGPVDLRINQVKSSCGCTTVDFPKIVKPGEFGEIVLEMNTGKVRTSTIRKYATIRSNDPTKKNLKVYIGGEIISLIAHEPKNVTLAGLAGAPLEGKVIITPGTDMDIKVESATTKGKNVQVLGIEEIEEGKRYVVTLQARASQRAARSRDNLEVTLTTPDGKTRTSSIVVTVNHKHRIQVTPRGNVVFQRKDTATLKREGAKPIRRDIILTSGAEEIKFNIEDVRIEDVPDGVFSAEVTTLEEGSRYKVTVLLNEYHEAARFLRGKLIVVTDDPQMPNRQVRLFAQFGNTTPRKGNANVAGRNKTKVRNVKRTPAQEARQRAVAEKKRKMIEEAKREAKAGGISPRNAGVNKKSTTENKKKAGKKDTKSKKDTADN